MGNTSSTNERIKEQKMDIKTEILNRHNNYRKKHRAPSLQIRDDLNKSAQKHADYLSKSGNFKHSRTPNVGENLFYCTGSNSEHSLRDAVDSWYSESRNYNFSNLDA